MQIVEENVVLVPDGSVWTGLVPSGCVGLDWSGQSEPCFVLVFPRPGSSWLGGKKEIKIFASQPVHLNQLTPHHRSAFDCNLTSDQTRSVDPRRDPRPGSTDTAQTTAGSP